MMTNMVISRLSRATLCGLILAGMYIIFFCATFLSWVLKGTWDAQIAAAFVSAPVSVLALDAARPLLQALGGYESAARATAVWLILFLAGCIQYFTVGFMLGKFWSRSS